LGGFGDRRDRKGGRGVEGGWKGKVLAKGVCERV